MRQDMINNELACVQWELWQWQADEMPHLCPRIR